MPVRPGAGAPEPKAPKAPKAGKAKAETAPTPVKEGTVKKSPLVEKAKRMLEELCPNCTSHIIEATERQVSNDDGGKTNIAFFQFSEDVTSDGVDHDYNTETIKSVLLAFHTIEDTSTSESPLMVEVLPPASAEESYVLCVH